MNKTLLTLAVGYIAGIYVATRYPSGRQTRTDMSLREFVAELERIHCEAYAEVESSQFGRDAQEKIDALRKSFTDEAEAFRIDAEALMERLKNDGVSAAKDLESELTDLYDRRREILAKLEDTGIEQISGARNTIAKLGRETLSRLESQYENIRHNIKKQLEK
ncbi:MAG TPA: hypothetical protein PK765_02195 [bacterium]|nr:hypothetical protein [bacterium]